MICEVHARSPPLPSNLSSTKTNNFRRPTLTTNNCSTIMSSLSLTKDTTAMAKERATRRADASRAGAEPTLLSTKAPLSAYSTPSRSTKKSRSLILTSSRIRTPSQFRTPSEKRSGSEAFSGNKENQCRQTPRELRLIARLKRLEVTSEADEQVRKASTPMPTNIADDIFSTLREMITLLPQLNDLEALGDDGCNFLDWETSEEELNIEMNTIDVIEGRLRTMIKDLKELGIQGKH